MIAVARPARQGNGCMHELNFCDSLNRNSVMLLQKCIVLSSAAFAPPPTQLHTEGAAHAVADCWVAQLQQGLPV
jgi:hypothetical protein